MQTRPTIATPTYLLTPWCRVLLEKLTGLQLVKKFPAFDGTRRFITALTSVRHLSLSWASQIQSIYPHPTSWRSVLILSTHLRLGLPSGLFPSGFSTKTLSPTIFEIMETMSVTQNSKKPSNYITVWMFRLGASASLGSEMTTAQGSNYPRSSGNIRYLISSSKVLESMLVINSVTNYMPPNP